MTEFHKTAVLGAGVIGASWAALFLASGREVAVYDASPDAEEKVRAFVKNAWQTMDDLGLVADQNSNRLRFFKTPGEAVEGASFIQESVPERLAIKYALYSEIEPHLSPDAIVATSASGLMLSEMQVGWKNPGRFVLGHPFNPPHLIPLVEIMDNERTDAGVVDAADRFYTGIGKITIRVRREVLALLQGISVEPR